jgi:outer membrane protein OmpA-like peptidoglycan-associated protein
LPKGKKFTLFFHVSGKDCKYDFDIPNEPGERSYRFTYQVPVRFKGEFVEGSSEEERGVSADESEATFIVQNLDKERLPNQHLRILNDDGSLKTEAKTDTGGVFKCMLIKGKSFKLITYVQGEEFISRVTVPKEIDYFIYRFNVGSYSLTKKDSATEQEFKYPAGSPLVKVIIRVVDKYQIPEQDAIVKVLYDDKQVFKAKTNIDGECDTIFNRENIYKVIVEKFGHTFPFTLEIPKNYTKHVFLFEVEIQIVKSYSRTINLDIQFESGKYEIKKNSFPNLDNFGKYMKENPALLIEIGGHTDDVGDEQMNMRLSQNRSNVVRDYLMSKWEIEPYRMLPKGYGESQPIATNKTPTGRQKNRRTEAKIIDE